jgi:hypothetical protein
MSEDQYFFRMGKLKGKDGRLKALRHNKRKLPKAHHIDERRSHLNYALVGDSSPEEIERHVRTSLLTSVTSTLRKDAVMGVEIIFSLPSSRHNQDTRPFFEDCFRWVESNISGVLIAFDVHLDESAPHAHALILPLVDGAMIGSKVVGNTTNLHRLRNLFMEEVGKKHFLYPKKLARLTKATLDEWASLVLGKLTNDVAAESIIFPAIKEAVANNPAPFAKLLAIEPPTKKTKKHFVDYARAKGRGTFYR